MTPDDGYEGVTHAGLLVVAQNTGRMVLAQRAMDDSDDPDVQETWEFPGGSLDGGEDPQEGALREFFEEIGVDLRPGEVVHGWRAGADGHYQGFVLAVDDEFEVEPGLADPEEVQDVGWFTVEETATLNLRPEVAALDLAALVATAVSGNEDEMDEEVTDSGDSLEALFDQGALMSAFDLAPGPIPVHGVIAPEETLSGDGRAFNSGAMTSRPLRLPLRHQQSDIGGHDGAVTVGSIDRMMRKDGLIHWEGSLMSTSAAEDLFDLLLHFGRYGLSVDGDRGGLDERRSRAENATWFDAIRASAATAVAIPAFHEAYVALGPHPEMPQAMDAEGEALVASMQMSGDLIGSSTFDRGPGWVTNPVETKRIHDYWTKKGQPGYAKIAWGTNGDFTRCTRLVGEKIAKNSPEDLRFMKRICAQWHHDALGYWPGELGKPGNAPDTPENRRRAATHADSGDVETFSGAELYETLDTPEKVAAWAKRMRETLDNEDIEATDDGGWEAVLVSSVSGNRVRPPLSYFHRQEDAQALTVEDPDADGIRRVHGYAAYWGVCHVGMDGRCVEPPRTGSDDYPEFHLGRTRTDEGYIYTGVLTYGVGHRDAVTILREEPEQAYFDNINNAWAAVRVGEDDIGIWFSGVVLPGVPDDHLVAIEASGQVSGEWKRGAMRACLTVNVPGFPVERPSAEYDEQGNVLALAASAYGGVTDAPCSEVEASDEDVIGEIAVEVEARIRAMRQMDVLRAEYAAERFASLKAEWEEQ